MNIYLTEEQAKYIIREQVLSEMLNESFSVKDAFEKVKSLTKSPEEAIEFIKERYKSGLIGAAMASALIVGFEHNFDGVKTLLKGNEIASQENSDKEENKKNNCDMNGVDVNVWEPIADDVIVTVYNAVPNQCNSDVKHTASMFSLNLNDPASHRIIAMERTMMSEFGLKYGDVVFISGTYKGRQDGVFRIEDTMNKRFAGMHKVDVLVNNGIKYGGTTPDKKATVYVLKDKSMTEEFKNNMAPEAK